MEALWRAERRKIRGGQPTYSDLAIAVCLTFGMVYKPPLRQTESFVRSLFRLMGWIFVRLISRPFRAEVLDWICH